MELKPGFSRVLVRFWFGLYLCLDGSRLLIGSRDLVSRSCTKDNHMGSSLFPNSVVT